MSEYATRPRVRAAQSDPVGVPRPVIRVHAQVVAITPNPPAPASAHRHAAAGAVAAARRIQGYTRATAKFLAIARRAVRWDVVGRTLVYLAAATIVAGLLGLAAWAVITVVAAILTAIHLALAWISAHLLLLGLIATLALFGLGAKATSCAGLHCGGCRKH